MSWRDEVEDTLSVHLLSLKQMGIQLDHPFAARMLSKYVCGLVEAAVRNPAILQETGSTVCSEVQGESNTDKDQGLSPAGVGPAP